MKTIIDKLKETLTEPRIGRQVAGGQFEPLLFVYADEGLQNITLAQEFSPFAAVVPRESTAVQLDGGQYHERLTVSVFFGDLMAETGVDYDGVENEQIIQPCKQSALMWLTYLADRRRQTYFRLISVQEAGRGFLRLDDNFTGFFVTVVLEEIEGIGVCNWND